jgi:two-component system nitrogen regulation response regulator NtrX
VEDLVEHLGVRGEGLAGAVALDELADVGVGDRDEVAAGRVERVEEKARLAADRPAPRREDLPATVREVAQEGEVERLGSAKTIKVDVRVIAATNKNLEEEIEKGTFREDLYFRLSVIPIQLPPLRERTDDIPALVTHFTELLSRENNRKPPRFTAQALEFLKQQRWKGNIRELRNTVERLIIMADDRVDVEDLKDLVRLEPRVAAADNTDQRGTARPGTLREHKELEERRFLVEALRANGWNISKTAEVIDTPRSNLYKKLEQYNIRQETDG